MKGWTLASAVTPLVLVLCGESVAIADTWTGTWAASPQSSSTTFAQQTLRQVVHTSISGTAARIELSNAFGTQPVTIADVHVAQRDSGSSVVASSDCQVTFGGQSSTTIAVGDVAISDSIPFPVTALADVVVSFYLPEATGPATSHGLGQQTNYVVSGDVSGSATLANPQTNGSYFFLANLDVQSSAATGAVVTLGASITDGYASTSDENLRWPNDLAARVIDAGLGVGVLNQGISGNQLLVDGSGQSAINRFPRDVLAQPGVKWVIFSDDPINDLGDNNPPPTSAQLIAGATQLISQAHQSGLLFLVLDADAIPGGGLLDFSGRDRTRGVQRVRSRPGERMRRDRRSRHGHARSIEPHPVPAGLRQRRPPSSERPGLSGHRQRSEPRAFLRPERRRGGAPRCRDAGGRRDVGGRGRERDGRRRTGERRECCHDRGQCVRPAVDGRQRR